MTRSRSARSWWSCATRARTTRRSWSCYAPDIVSVEAGASAGMNATTTGRDAVLAKSKWWADNHIVHSSKVDGPWPHGDCFIVRFTYDITQKASNRRFAMDEAGLFTVANGKVVREEFFYAMG